MQGNSGLTCPIHCLYCLYVTDVSSTDPLRQRTSIPPGRIVAAIAADFQTLARKETNMRIPFQSIGIALAVALLLPAPTALAQQKFITIGTGGGTGVSSPARGRR